MKANRFLKVAAVLWGLAVLSAAMLTPSTFAKYAAVSSGGGKTRVAKWDAFQMIDPADDDDPVLLLLDPAHATQTTTITLTNNSDVTARYVLRPDVATVGTGTGAEKTAFLNGIVVTTNAASLAAGFGAYNNGIVIPYATGGVPTQVKLDIAFPASLSFSGLKIDVVALQVD